MISARPAQAHAVHSPAGIRRVGRAATTALRDFAGGLLDALMPRTCLGCEAWIPCGCGPLCAACRTTIERLMALSACPRCARSMRPESISGNACARCAHESFWNVRGSARVGPYDGPLRSMLLGLKYAARERNADFLAELLTRRIRTTAWGASVEVLVPVPMHRLRRWQRPCDHADLLARAVGRRLGVPVRRAAVRRLRYAPSQTRATTRQQRFAQVADCFGATRQPGVAGRTVCIIDNLLVSGATVHEVSKVLRAAGAKMIYAAVVSRAVMAGDFQATAEALAPADRRSA